MTRSKQMYGSFARRRRRIDVMTALEEWIDRLSPVEREQWEIGAADIWEINGEFCLVLLGRLEHDDH
jgi:hypothetical protein